MFTIRNFFFAILALLISAGSAAGQPRSFTCTQQTVVGTYAVAAEGTVLMTLPDMTQALLPVAGLSIVAIDSQGGVSAPGYIAVGGAAQYYPQMPGTITVNADCTGEIAWKNLEGETVMTGELIIHKRGNEINSILVQGSPLAAPTVTGQWKRISRVPDLQHQRVCRPGCVSGTYVARQSGVNIVDGVGAIPAALLGLVSIDHSGEIEMSGTAMIAGTPMPFTLVNGLWEEGELACTGRTTGSIMAGGINNMGELEGWIVVLDGGNKLWGIAIETGSGSPVALGTMKRVSRRPMELH